MPTWSAGNRFTKRSIVSDTVAECIDPERVDLMYKSGCDSVVCIAELASMMMVQEALDPGVQHVLKELATTSRGQQLFTVPVESMKNWRFDELRKSLLEQDALALGLVTERGVELNPKSDTEIKKTDKAVVLAPARPSPVRA